MTPSHAYYHYTTARVGTIRKNLSGRTGEDANTWSIRKTRSLHILFVMFLVGPPGIEPGLYEPESYVLPVYYGPTQNTTHGKS